VSTDALAAALVKATGALLGERQPGGHWTGKLSSSALSTATAVCALAIHRRHAIEEAVAAAPLILRGLDWLSRHVNPDGGWGDTDLSMSNLSTTALCWAAFGAADESGRYAQTVNRAEDYLRRTAGGIDPKAIAGAVTARYGNDRTFSVPILVTCALSGRFGRGAEAWREIRPLPFELGALRREWFGAMRLPVVSYALPALIALGQVIHHYRPPLNPLTRWLRNITRQPTLRVLSEIQPSNGGFLEATPLTSFVTMSLAAAGLANHSVTLKGIEFLARSIQDDGSWPIDTNLSTWLTTLSINAMPGQLDFEDRRRLHAWLLAQQFRSPHPYTNAAPGGWAWTDLPGGVPDADDTAGAVLALHNLGDIDVTVSSAALAGIRWLLDLQNRDGGIPTFCRGWGALSFDRSSPDLTAHAVRAWSIWLEELPVEARWREPFPFLRKPSVMTARGYPCGSEISTRPTTSTRRTERRASFSVCRNWPRGTSRCQLGCWRRRANGWCTRRIRMGAGAGFRRVRRQSRRLRSRLRRSRHCPAMATPRRL
jgi:squalene-hopene/tetraprenyl-beta-curcumene cyclase